MSESCITICRCRRRETWLTLVTKRCYCGNYLSHGTRRASEQACSHVCMGNQRSICGGRNTLSLYEVDEMDVTVS